MLKFEELKLDCHDHLYLFDGDIPTDKSKVYFWHIIEHKLVIMWWNFDESLPECSME